MGIIVPIVEGDGEVEAVPNIVNRLIEKNNCTDLFAVKGKNAHGIGNLTGTGGVERFTQLALCQPSCEGVLVLLDADEECAYMLSRDLNPGPTSNDKVD